MDALFQFAGRLHPMVLHAPIGLMIALLALEAVALVRRRPLSSEIRAALAWLTAAAALIAMTSGLVLSREGGHALALEQLHQYLGIGVATGAVLAAILQQTGKRAAYAVILLITIGVLIPTGHYGATMTHGPGFLTEPFTAHADPSPKPPLANADANSTFVQIVAPIFASRCAACHNADRHKGGLVLTTKEGLEAGGRNGPVIVASSPSESEMLRRLRLPLDDENHMPPNSKAQPTGEEIGAIESWIAAGASFDAAAPADSPAKPTSKPSAPKAPAAASAAALDAIRSRLVHVEPVARDSTLLIIDFSAIAKDVDDTLAASLLTPVREQVADLTLARTRISDTTVHLLLAMPHLRRLNLSATTITDAGISDLSTHPALTDLVLTQSKITDAAIDSLTKMPALKSVYVWKSALTDEGIKKLRAHRGLTVDAGDTLAAAPLEAETEVKLVDASGKPPASAPTPPATGAATDPLKPINTTCPVSGKPVDPDFAIVFKGKVVGFCCRHCLGQFLEDPSKFADKIH